MLASHHHAAAEDYVFMYVKIGNMALTFKKYFFKFILRFIINLQVLKKFIKYVMKRTIFHLAKRTRRTTKVNKIFL